MKKIYANNVKLNSSYRYGCFHVGRENMWGSYCPETGEYYLAHNVTAPIVGKCVEVLASARYLHSEWQEQAYRGYCYAVVRELLQLGHLTAKTLAAFIAAGGEVWWDQPNFFGSTDWLGETMLLLEEAHGDNIVWGGKERPCFAARAVSADGREYKCIWIDNPPEGMPEYWYEDPDRYIDWDKCDDAIRLNEYYPDEDEED